jgi:hypothetical protein
MGNRVAATREERGTVRVEVGIDFGHRAGAVVGADAGKGGHARQDHGPRAGGMQMSRLHTSARAPAPASRITVGLPWPRHSRYSFRPPISIRPEKSPVATGEVATCAAVACDAGPAGRMPTRKRTSVKVTGWRSMMFSLEPILADGPEACRFAVATRKFRVRQSA